MSASIPRSRKLQHLATAVIGVVILLVCIPRAAAAFQIVKSAVPIVGDFALDNAKIELTIDPGSIKTTSLRITNRTDQTRTFQVTVEDMEGTDNPSEPV